MSIWVRREKREYRKVQRRDRQVRDWEAWRSRSADTSGETAPPKSERDGPRIPAPGNAATLELGVVNK
jgi:hypothetical protein